MICRPPAPQEGTTEMPAVSDRVLLATDCGSTTTKAILVVRDENGAYRLAARGEAPTTVEAPFEDVTVGVRNAIEEIEAMTGRRLLDHGRLIQPSDGDTGVDAYFSTSSAGGGLQMAVAGVTSRITAQSAQRAALGAGAIVINTLCLDDPREDHIKIEALRRLRPDMILLAGGVNGGTQRHVGMLAEVIAAARPQPRFGSGFALPVIFAGNSSAREAVEERLAAVTSLRCVENVRPTLSGEALGGARQAIHDLFLEHVMQQAPGYPALMAMTSAPVMPTPSAVGLLVEEVAATRRQNVLAVDIGGATTDVFSVFGGHFHRTVSANYGMSYSLCNVMAETGVDNILRWLPFPFEAALLRDVLRNKMIRPTTVPETMEELYVEQAVAREALRLSLVHHKALAVRVGADGQRKSLEGAFSAASGELTNLMSLDLCIGSGGVLSHAPDRAQAALMMLDAFQLEGITQLAVDSIFMMPQLGVMSQVHPQAASEVFQKDCLVPLGTAVAPVGVAKENRTVMTVDIVRPDGNRETVEVKARQLLRLPLGPDETAHLTIHPARGFDAGAGKGKVVEADVTGGEVGLLLDGRGRPLPLAENPAANTSARRQEYESIGLRIEEA